MCRMCMVISCDDEGVLLADIITKPAMSIIRQSFCSQERAKLPHGRLPNLSYEQSYLNGDGYGVGWYCNKDPVPCVFTSTKPAWNDENLENLAEKIRSEVVLAHVRAAGPGTPVGEVTCHPFRAGKFLWMHNGLLGGFSKTRRPLIDLLDNRSFELAMKHSGIDSVVAFALFMTVLNCRRCSDSECDDIDPWMADYPPTVILEALEETVTTIIKAGQDAKVTDTSLLNFIVTDGDVVLATRVVDNPNVEEDSGGSSAGDVRSVTSCSSENGDAPTDEVANAASLYLSTGHAWVEGKDKGVYHMEQTDIRNQTIIISSEPLSTARDEWMPVPANHVVMCSRAENHIDVTFVQYPKKPKHVSSVIDLIQGASSHQKNSLLTTRRDPAAVLTAQLAMTFTHDSSTTCLTSCGDGEFLIGGMQDGSVVVWDLVVSRATEPRRHPGPVLSLLVDEDPERRLLFSSSHNELRIWDISDVLTRVPDSTIACISVFKFTPTCGLLLSLCGDASRLYLGFQSPQILCLRLWEYRDELSKAKSRSRSIRYFTVDLGKVGDGRGEGRFRPEWVVHPVGGREDQHNGFVYDMTIVGDELVTAGGDGRLLIWKGTTYVAALMGHRSGVTSLARLNTHVISGSFDSTIREWDIATRRCLRTVHNPAQSPVLSLRSVGQDSILAAFVSEKTRRYEIVMWDFSEANSVESRIEGCGFLTKQASHINFHVLQVSKGKVAVAVGGSITGDIGIYDIGLKMLDGPSCPPTLVFRNEIVEMLRGFVAIPSVHTDKPACRSAAKWIASHFESIGATVITHAPATANPIVLAHLTWSPDLPTVILYSHYDVVPPGDGWVLDETEISPWDLTGNNGFVYGRGVTDNKGPAVAQFHAVKQLVDEGGLGVNILFICEGDEENMGGGALQEALTRARQRGWLHNVFGAVVTNSTWIDETHPCLCYGSRGVIDLEIAVSGPNQQLHTGSHGGIIAEPLHDLIGVVSQITDPTGRVPIPSFYASVPHPNAFDDAALAAAAGIVDFDGLKRSLQVPGFLGDGAALFTGVERVAMLLRKNWLQPSLCVTEIGTKGESSTVIRRAVATRCTADISIRTVPGQNRQEVISSLQNHLNYEFTRRSSPNTLTLTKKCDIPPWEGDPTSPLFHAAEAAVGAVWGMRPLYVREGGTMPVLDTIQTEVGVPVLQLPLGQSKDGAHLSNERMRVENLLKGTEVVGVLLKNLGNLAGGRRSAHKQDA